MNNIKITLKDFLNEQQNNNVFIAYHSSHDDISNFNHDDISYNPQSSTRMEAIYFSNIPQSSWGNILYKVRIISKNPLYYDLNKSYYDSLGIQEVFNEFLSGNDSYLFDDLIKYGGLDKHEAKNFIKKHKNPDLIILNGVKYARHDIEYIVPSKRYEFVRDIATIEILEKVGEKPTDDIKRYKEVYYIVLSSNGKFAYLDDNYKLTGDIEKAKLYHNEYSANEDIKKYAMRGLENWYSVESKLIEW